MRAFRLFLLGFALLLFAGDVIAEVETTYDINLEVKTFQLENGMLFLVVERSATPQVAARLAIRAGSALEETGKTGIAHLLEHMMFKGTKNFGTLDYQKDMDLQAQIEDAYQVVLKERRKRHPDQDLINKKLDEMDRLRREVQRFLSLRRFHPNWGKTGLLVSMLTPPKIRPSI